MAAYSVCPCCGAPRDLRGATFDADFRTLHFAGRTLLLQPRLFELAQLLHSTLPRPAYRDWLGEMMQAPDGHIRSYVSQLRAKLRAVGADISYSDGHYLLTHARGAEAVAVAGVVERRTA